jgi:peptide/nickel transport system substrate-binding protein
MGTLLAVARRVVAGALILSIAACTRVGGSGTGGAGRHSYTQPHVLRYAAAEDIVGLNPLMSTQAVVSSLSEMTMAWLVRTDAQSEPTIPELATDIPSKTNGGISPDGKTITWHLRKGVKWSDGQPFDADDVVFSTNAVNNQANNVVSRDGWELIEKIDEPDKYTVVYHLKKPYSSFLETFFTTAGANPAIMPKHLLDKYKNLNDVPYNALPVGIGPFKYEAWRRGDSVTLVADPLYWRGQPKIQRVLFKIIPDRNTVLEQMKTHELDLWTPVAPHYVNDLRKIAGMNILMTPSFFYDHIDFNLSHPAMQDPAVRQALRYATDRKAINDKVRFGLYILDESVVVPASSYHENLSLVPFDIAKANKILDDAGWVRGADGIRSKNGLRLALQYASSTGSPDTDTQLLMIGGWWKQLGVEFTVHRYLSAVMFATIQSGGIVYSGKFDAINFGWGADPNEDLTNLFSCNRFPPNGQNDPRYCNRQVTAALDHEQSHYGRAERAGDLKFIQEQIYKDVPTIVLDARKEIYAFNDDLKGWKPNPVAPFDSIMDADI